MKKIKYTIGTLLLFLSIQLNGQRAIAVQSESSGSDKLDISDCFSLKTYPGASGFINVNDKKFWLKQYFFNRKDKGRHYYKISIDNPEQEELWIHNDSLSSSWKRFIEKNNSTIGGDMFMPEFSTIHFNDLSSGWMEGFGKIVSFKRLKNGQFDFHWHYNYPTTNQAFETVEQDDACLLPWGKSTTHLTAVVNDDNLWIYDKSGSTQLTHDGGKGIVYGQTVHRSEFGITKGLFWSPKGNKLAFYRKDERRVKDYPIFDITERPNKTVTFKYPMAGDSSHTVTVGIYDTRKKDSILYLKTEGPYDQYLTNITWSPDEKSIYIAWVNREQNAMELRRYDANTGLLDSVLFTEAHEKYVEPENGPAFIPGSNESFIWQSERDEYNHLYVYDKSGLRQLTKGSWIVTDFLGFDKSGKYALVNSTLDGLRGNALERTPLLVDIQNGEIFEMSTGFGVNTPTWHKSTGQMIIEFSNLNTPNNQYLIDVDAFISNIKKTVEVKATLLEEIQNPVSNFEIGLISLSSIKNEGVDLYTRTYYPVDFNPKKKYPAVVYVYGGPHAQMIQNKWLGGGNLWMAYMASKGYIVFTLDNRGSANRGLNFENEIHRQLGEVEMRDQLAGIAHLKSLPFVDTSRIGIHGWSFGGFMTTSLMTRHPHVFKAGVAGGPVIDWKYYEIMYTERYMDKPEENPDGYAKNSLLQYAPKLKNRLLMIHGADDDVVVWQHSLMFLEKSIKASNENLDYYVYPGHKHNVIGRDRLHLYKKVSQYFFDHL